MNEQRLEKWQLVHIKKSFQSFIAGRPTEDEQICVSVLKCCTPAEKVFVRNVYLPNKMAMEEWIKKCAEDAGFTSNYGWLLLRLTEARYAKEKGWE